MNDWLLWKSESTFSVSIPDDVVKLDRDVLILLKGVEIDGDSLLFSTTIQYNK
jgi:hypothetical protein